MLEHSPVVPPIVELGRGPAGTRCRSPSATLAGSPGRSTLVPTAGRAARPDAPVALDGRERDGRARPPRRAVRDCRPRPAAGRVTALMGRNGSGKSSLLWALQGGGRRTGGSVSAGRRATRPTWRRPRAGPGRAGAADRGRPALPRDRRRGVCGGRRRRRAPGGAILDRLVPGIPDDAPARPLRGTAAGAGARDRADRRAAGRAARRADPRPRLRREGALAEILATSQPTGAPCSSRRTTSSSWPRSPTGSSCWRRRGGLRGPGPAGRRRVAGLRPAGHQGPRPALALRGRGRGRAGRPHEPRRRPHPALRRRSSAWPRSRG